MREREGRWEGKRGGEEKGRGGKERGGRGKGEGGEGERKEEGGEGTPRKNLTNPALLQKFRYGVPPFQKVPVWRSGAFRLSLSTGPEAPALCAGPVIMVYVARMLFAKQAPPPEPESMGRPVGVRNEK